MVRCYHNLYWISMLQHRRKDACVDRNIKRNPGHTYVFLYYTEADLANADDVSEGKDPVENRLYRLVSANTKLVNQNSYMISQILLWPHHNGGAIVIGPDNNLYIRRRCWRSHKEWEFETETQNYPDCAEPDGRGGILRVTLDGEPVSSSGIIGDRTLNCTMLHVRTASFGINFDPITGNLWDTENGPGEGDEINLVEPGFKSGWVQGKRNVFFLK